MPANTTTLPPWVQQALEWMRQHATTTTPATTAVKTTAANAAQELGKFAKTVAGQAAKGAAAGLPIGAIIAGFIMLAVLFYIFYVLSRGRPKGVWALIIDPQTLSYEFRRIIEVSPGIYASRDGSLIAFIPSNATPLTGPKGDRVYPLVRVGDAYIYSNPESMFEITMGLGELQFRPQSVAELILHLYKNRELPADMVLRPDMKVTVYLDGRRLAEALANIYDREAEEGVVSIASLTGKRKEFEEYVKTLVEATARKAEAIASRVMTVIIVLGIIAAVVYAITHFVH